MSNKFYRLVALINRLFQRDYYSQCHLSLHFEGLKPVATIQNHLGYVESIQEELNKTKFSKNNFEEKVSEIFWDTRFCNYVCFSANDKFVQFWTGDSGLVLDFPMLPTNQLGTYYHQIMGVLSEIGFLREIHVFEPERFLWMYLSNQLKFRVMEENGNKIIRADFHKNYKLATRFTATVFRKIYKEPIGQIVISVG